MVPANLKATLAKGERLRGARRVTVLTGAGISAASGVPTFRGAAGLWRNYRPEDLATPEAFARDPILLWEWYAWRRETIAGCIPNAAHEVLARWSQGGDGGATIVTQNVDDLHLLVPALRASCACTARSGSCRVRGLLRSGVGAVARRADGSCRGCLSARTARRRRGRRWSGSVKSSRGDRRAALEAPPATCSSPSARVRRLSRRRFVDQARRFGTFTAEINADSTPATALVDFAVQGAAEKVLPELDHLIAPSATAAPPRPDGAA